MANNTGQKYGGRTKGTPNRTTAETKEILQTVISKELDNTDTLLEQLEPKERLDAIIKILPYIIPKQSEMTIENKETDFKPVVIQFIDNEDVKSIVEDFEKKY